MTYKCSISISLSIFERFNPMEESDVITDIFTDLKEGRIKDYDDFLLKKAELEEISIQGHSGGNRNFYLIVVSLIIIVAVVLVMTIMGDIQEKASITGEPVQKACSNRETIVRDINGNRYNIFLVADYIISGKVVSTKRYTSDVGADILPYDVGFVWGELIRPKYDKYVTNYHNDRTLFTTFYSNCPLSFEYVRQHVSNTHVIIPNDNIFKGIESIKKNQFAVLEGYLANIEGNVKGQTVIWKTSLVRDDEGDGACETMYVKKVTIGNRVYE